jgi:uncharacterized protein involved in exopolysaccharide biosynthesis/Mrp family chromosome partitioning ATPase
MSPTDYRPQDADVDLGRLFAALWRDKFRILTASLILTALVFAALSIITPKYQSDARVLIEASESVFTRPERNQNEPSDTSVLDQEGVASQVEILTSSDLLMQVAEDLDLAQSDEFNEALAMTSLKAGLVALGLIEDPNLVPVEKRVLDNVRERLDVNAVPDSRVIVIEFRSRDKELAALFPNALASAYLTLESRAELENTGKAANYLASEIDGLQDSVREAEAAVAAFRSSSDLLIGQNDSILATQQLTELASELSRVKAERSSAEARARSVKAALDSGASIDALPEVVESPLIARLREREIELNAEIAELSTTLLSGHPRIQSLRSQVNDLSRQIRAEARKVLIGLQSQAEIARSREQELIADLNELKAASANASEREVELNALEREAEAQRALLESYLVRFREARSRDEGQYAPANARLISRAIVPSEPVFPKMIPMLGAAFFISLIVMMLATLVRELFSGRAFVYAKPQAPRQPAAQPQFAGESAANSPQPAAADPVAASALVHEPVAMQQAESAANDNHGVSALVASLVEKGADRAIIVSPEGDAGAAASVAVVRSLANEGLRAILVDLTGSGAASRRMMKDPDTPGITDLLCASSSYSDVICPDFATGAHIIPTGTADPERAMRGADRLPIIIDALVSAYDIVIVECGPTNAAGLRRLVGEGTQVVLSVVDPSAPEIVETADNLVGGGYEDLMLVTADESSGDPHDPQPRRAYAR